MAHESRAGVNVFYVSEITNISLFFSRNRLYCHSNFAAAAPNVSGWCCGLVQKTD